MRRAEYRQDSHVASLFAWAILSAAVATFLFLHSGKLVSRPLAAAEIAGGVALLILGPAALAVYVWRARRVWISVEGREGILVSGKALIPWDAIERVERRRPRLRKKAGPAETVPFGEIGAKDALGNMDGCLLFGEAGLLVLAVGLLVVAVGFLFWIVFFAFVPLVIVPVLEVFAPLGDRVKVVVRDGRPLVLRDLRDADGFLAEIRDRATVIER